jgi:hypothetical protein
LHLQKVCQTIKNHFHTALDTKVCNQTKAISILHFAD